MALLIFAVLSLLVGVEFYSTDTQWATWEGVLNYYKENEAYLQGQLGNPKGEDQPNKKYYDPRVWLRAGQTSMIARLEKAFQELNAIDVL